MLLLALNSAMLRRNLIRTSSVQCEFAQQFGLLLFEIGSE